MHRTGRFGILLVTALVVGCGLFGPAPVVDGWEIGDPVDCTQNSECEAFIPAAIEGLDRRDPGHLPIVRVRLHVQGKPGQFVLYTCSGGCPVVAVFDLLDGSVRAMGVGTPGIATEPMTFDYGPRRDGS